MPTRLQSLLAIIPIVWGSLSPTFVTDILGTPREIIKSMSNETSEYSIIHSSLRVKLHYILHLVIPSLPLPRPHYIPTCVSTALFGQRPAIIPSKFIQDPSLTDSLTDSLTTKWFFLNGMGNCVDVAIKTQTRLESLFKVPVDLIYDPSNSIPVDLFECLTEKQWNDKYPITFLVYQTLINALTNDAIDKVVFICHSRGTIITANVLRLLKPLMPKYLCKLEIYAFANCASHMRYLTDDSYPYIESIGNRHDTVAKLGMFATHHSVVIDGDKFVNPIKHGHLMNLHYLNNFETETEYIDTTATDGILGTKCSRLYSYLDTQSAPI